MQEVSANNGRTILFVSHNMQAITNLCTTAFWLDKGKIKTKGSARDVVSAYIGSSKQYKSGQTWDTIEEAPGNHFIRMKSIEIMPHTPDNEGYITVQTPIELNVEFWCLQEGFDMNVNVRLMTPAGECVFDLGSPSVKAEKTVLHLRSIIPGNLLNNTTYVIALTAVKNYSVHLYAFTNCISFDVEDMREGIPYFGIWPGIIRPQIETSFSKKEVFETKT